MSEAPPSKEAAPAECPVCYERFQPLEATQRRLSCGHTFCHDCLVKCLLSAKLGGHVQSSIVCPVCRFVTFLSRRKVLWLPRAADPRVLQVSLSPSSLSQLARSEPPNTLVVPSHFVLPEQSVGRVSPGAGLAREAHIFVISEHGMPLLAAQRCGSGLPGGTGGDTASTGSVSVSSSPALGLQCCQSPMALAVMLVLTVAMLAAVLPWLLLVRRDL
ncbi:RING finger protein 222-like [Ammospiza caudacuta]|uniref:RING finger protein 222-like n=1 Tax=Ammospiza caudacuta TaxID=2857398 RepID=UPI002739D77C|nr:RING finger protein 222-like [Ammospiza caudacuta]